MISNNRECYELNKEDFKRSIDTEIERIKRLDTENPMKIDYVYILPPRAIGD